MSKVDDGDPAFPFTYMATDPNYPPTPMTHSGMSLRDWFAGQALPPCVTMVISIETSGGALKKDAPICAAEMAYQIADAMLAAKVSPHGG